MSGQVDEVRAASRRLAREFGFLGGGFAGTDLSPAALHAPIEVEARPGLGPRELAELKRLDRSSASRLARRLVRAGDLAEERGAAAGRVRTMSLTEAGRRRVAAIHAHARGQVAAALGGMSEAEARTVRDALRLYAEALAGPAAAAAPRTVAIAAGYRTGLIARITGLHADFYAREARFGLAFEAVVAGGLAEFCARLDSPRNGIWTALVGGEVAGSVAIDGENLGPGVAHLRWFIVADGLRGRGAGGRLLAAALDHVDRGDAAETHLWTFAGLDAARRLYEANGFHLAESGPGDRWGREVIEQRFVRRRP